MTDIFNFETHPDPYGVMGNPISHSKSPQIHQQFAQQTSQSITYQAIHVDIGGFPQAVGNFFANGGKGLNVTVPFKQEAFRLVDECTERATMAGAVNTISLKSDGTLLGDNTDGIGLVRDLRDNNQVVLHNKNILILGAGGASRGIIQPLLLEGIAELVIANRTPYRAEEIAKQFDSYNSSAKISTCSFAGISTNISFDVIINATSASLSNEALPIADEHIQSHSCCYDMMYGKSATVFMQWAQRGGAYQVLDGLGMLVEQAAESFRLWRDVKPDTKAVISWLRQNL